MSPNFDPTGRPPREIARSQAWYNASDVDPRIGLGNDDSGPLATVVDTLDAMGGAGLMIDRRVMLTADLEVPRTVALGGVHPTKSIIVSDGTQRRVKVKGVASDAPDFEGDLYEVVGLTFDNVSLVMGPDAGDVPRGQRARSCQFVNSDYGLYIEGINGGAFAGVGAIDCKFRVCGNGILFNRAGPNNLVANCDVSECTEAGIKVNGVITDGISMFVSNTYCDHSARFIKAVGPINGDGGIYVRGGGIELVGSGNAGPYADGYAIENEGCQIWLEQVNCFAGPDTTAILWNKGGVIYVKSGRWYWPTQKFCRISGGTIVFHQEDVFSGEKLWGGDGMVAFATASSSGGKVVAPRSGFIGNFNYNLPQLTAASSTYNLRCAEAYDANDRVWEFEVVSLGNGTTNTLRIDFADGVNTIRCDMNFPIIAGGGSFRLVNKRGSEFVCYGTYAPDASPTIAAASANPVPKTDYDTAVARYNKAAVFLRRQSPEASVLANTKFLAFSTLGGNPGASTINVFNLVEQVVGPYQVGI
jgi:hypothetical protein